MLIAIEGCVGVGKTTVTKGLAAVRSSEILLERFESNPFLEAFYKDPDETALETEFAFLLLHFHQLKVEGAASASSEVIADFHLGKDLLYADLNLRDERAKALFRSLYDLCNEKTSTPTVMVFLSATTDLLVQRIRARNRGFELTVDPSYYGAVNDAYEAYFAKYPGLKLRVSMDEWDFVTNPALYHHLSHLIDEALGQP